MIQSRRGVFAVNSAAVAAAAPPYVKRNRAVLHVKGACAAVEDAAAEQTGGSLIATNCAINDCRRTSGHVGQSNPAATVAKAGINQIAADCAIANGRAGARGIDSATPSGPVSAYRRGGDCKASELTEDATASTSITAEPIAGERAGGERQILIVKDRTSIDAITNAAVATRER